MSQNVPKVWDVMAAVLQLPKNKREFALISAYSWSWQAFLDYRKSEKPEHQKVSRQWLSVHNAIGGAMGYRWVENTID